MEIEVTAFVRDADPSDYSKPGYADPSGGTGPWQAAVAAGQTYPMLDTPEKLEAMREYAAGFGAWSRDELADWSDAELNALLIQLVSAARLDKDDEGCELFWTDDGAVYYTIEG